MIKRNIELAKCALLALFAVAVTSSCSKNGVEVYESQETKSVAAWIGQNRSDMTQKDEGLYLKFHRSDSSTSAVAPYSDETFVEVRFLAQSLEGNYFYNMYPMRARELGTFSYATDYTQPFKVKYENIETMLTSAQARALELMNSGDSVEIVATSDFIVDGGLSSNYKPSGYNGNLSYGAGPAYFAMQYVSRIDDINKHEREAVIAYAKEQMGLEAKDSLATGSLIYKQIITPSDSVLVDETNTIRINYTLRSLNDFVISTNQESVARDHNIFNDDNTYTPFYIYDLDDSGSDMMEALRLAVKSMKIGEKSKFVFTYNIGYGEDGYVYTEMPILPFTSLVYEIEVIDQL